jgi:DNA helicase MCM9
MELLDWHHALAHVTLSFAERMLPLFREGLMQAQHQLYAASEQKTGLLIKTLCTVRMFNLHLCEETSKPNISSIRSTDVGRYLSIAGTVIRTGVVKMLESEREYECQKCKHRFRVMSELENNNTITLPKQCNSNGM